ncbi:hypothetical protein MRX96_032642 [Rhipicephalus microplus]
MASGPTTAADDMPRLQGVVEELLLGTDGSAMERERPRRSCAIEVARSCGGGSCAGSTRGSNSLPPSAPTSRRLTRRRLKAEPKQRTQHPEENLKEFIYAIATFYDRIGEEVSEAEKVQRVLRQTHPQLQDLAEGQAYNDLAELVKAADGLMERAWRRLQYSPPPLPSNPVARDLAFRPSQAPDHHSLPQPNRMATASCSLRLLLPHRHRRLITGHCIQLR